MPDLVVGASFRHELVINSSVARIARHIDVVDIVVVVNVDVIATAPNARARAWRRASITWASAGI